MWIKVSGSWISFVVLILWQRGRKDESKKVQDQVIVFKNISFKSPSKVPQPANNLFKFEPISVLIY